MTARFCTSKAGPFRTLKQTDGADFKSSPDHSLAFQAVEMDALVKERTRK